MRTPDSSDVRAVFVSSAGRVASSGVDRADAGQRALQTWVIAGMAVGPMTVFMLVYLALAYVRTPTGGVVWVMVMGLLLVAAGSLVAWGTILGMQWAWARRNEQSLAMARDAGRARSAEQAALIDEAVVRAAGPVFRKPGRRWRFAATRWIALNAPPPRAVVFGPASAWSHLARTVPPDLLEPEMIRPRLGGSVWRDWARRPFRWWQAITLAVALSWFGWEVLGGFRTGVWMAMPRLAVLILVPGLVISTLAHLVRKSGHDLLGGPGLTARPGEVEWVETLHTRRWTPADTIMLVRRSAFGGAVMVDLVSDRTAGSSRSAQIVFFSARDEGFLTLWRMWMHPTDVGLLNAQAPARAGKPPVAHREGPTVGTGGV
jgi:hypothetical protein